MAPTSSRDTASSHWFGSAFVELDPILQDLHREGGILSGSVEIGVPAGLAGIVGRSLARRLGVPIDRGRHDLTVTISHGPDALNWDRRFDGRTVMKSVFRPVGQRPDGYWVERSGSVTLLLTVDVIDGGWYWRCFQVKALGLRFPAWLFPRSRAYKRIEDGLYRFYVGFSFPVLGTVLSYGGLLKPVRAAGKLAS
jgi:hypothetical protein